MCAAHVVKRKDRLRKVLTCRVRGLQGVMVSTLEFESSDPSSNLGGTFSQKPSVSDMYADVELQYC